MKLIKHIIIIIKHKILVFRYCFKCRLYFRGLVHDLSKFSLTELSVAKYYSGKRSPISAERNAIGYSKAYLHHKKNKHHFEYWMDFFDEGIILIRMPYKYAAEMICDMLAAGKVYYRKEWTTRHPLDYFNRHLVKYQKFLHPDSLNFVLTIFTELTNSNIKAILKSRYLKSVYQANLNSPITILKK